MGAPHHTAEKVFEGHVNASLTNRRTQCVAHNAATPHARASARGLRLVPHCVNGLVIAFTGTPKNFFGWGA